MSLCPPLVESGVMQAASGGPIDLLSTDLRMPRIAGRELAAKLETNRARTKVLFTLGFAELALRPGAGLLREPFTVGTLPIELREALNNKYKFQK